MVCSAAQPCVSCHARLRVPLTIFCPLGTTLRHRSRSVLAKAPLPAGLLLRVASDSKGKLLPRDDGLWGDSAAQPCESGRAASSLASLEPFTAARPQSSFSGSCEMMYAKALSAASSRQSWHGWGILSEMPGAPVSNAKLNLNHVVALSSL